MAITNVSRSATLASHEDTFKRNLSAVSSATSGRVDKKYANIPVAQVGRTKLPTVKNTDLEKEARELYKTRYEIEILNNAEEKAGHYNKSDFTRLSLSELDDRIKKVKEEAEHIRRTYKEMEELSPEMMITLRHLTWLQVLRSNYRSQEAIAKKQAQYETQMRSSSRTDKDILHNKQYTSDHTEIIDKEIVVPRKPKKKKNNSDKSDSIVDDSYAGSDSAGAFSDTDEPKYDIIRTREVKTTEPNNKAYNNARSQVYDSMEHENPWITTINAKNRIGDRISRFFGGGSSGSKNSFSKEESTAKKHLKEARRIIVTNNLVNKDSKFKVSGPFDKYTTDAIIKFTEGKDLYNIKDIFTDKEIAYIKDVISKMKPDYTWEFAVEDTYIGGELFSECESSLVNVESDELVEESAIEELQQLADLL